MLCFMSHVLETFIWPGKLPHGLTASMQRTTASCEPSSPYFRADYGIMGSREQGLGSPACARILTSWYPDRERGTFWGFWTASNNIGGFLAPIIAGNAAAHYGWRCNPDLVTSVRHRYFIT